MRLTVVHSHYEQIFFLDIQQIISICKSWQFKIFIVYFVESITSCFMKRFDHCNLILYYYTISNFFIKYNILKKLTCILIFLLINTGKSLKIHRGLIHFWQSTIYYKKDWCRLLSQDRKIRIYYLNICKYRH